MILGPTRRLAAFVALLTASTALMVPGSAGASPDVPGIPATSTVPTDAAGHGKVVVAFADGRISAGTLGALRDSASSARSSCRRSGPWR